MIFRVEIETDGATFDGSMQDVAHELRRLLNKVVDDFYPASAYVPSEGKIMDLNGNTIGRWSLLSQFDEGKRSVEERIRQAYEDYPVQDLQSCPLDELLDQDGRFLLVERCHGGHFLTRHDTPDDAASYHDDQEDDSWKILTLIDLKTGEEGTPTTAFTIW